MLSFGFMDMLIVVALSVGGAGLLSAVLKWFSGRSTGVKPIEDRAVSKSVFLLDGAFLADSTPDARKLIATASPRMTDRDAIVSVLRGQFPDLEVALDCLKDNEVRHLAAAEGGPLRAELRGFDGLIRLTLSTDAPGGDASGYALATREALAGEVAFLRNVADKSPTLT